MVHLTLLRTNSVIFSLSRQPIMRLCFLSARISDHLLRMRAAKNISTLKRYGRYNGDTGWSISNWSLCNDDDDALRCIQSVTLCAPAIIFPVSFAGRTEHHCWVGRKLRQFHETESTIDMSLACKNAANLYVSVISKQKFRREQRNQKRCHSYLYTLRFVLCVISKRISVSLQCPKSINFCLVLQFSA